MVNHRRLAAWCAIIWLGCVCIATVHGHGMVLDPIARGSRWRCNPLALPNYTDNELFCGGFQVQWGTYNGKCGVCGDNYGDARPRRHELGGQYGQGDIVKQYVQGSIIEVRVRLTATHRGYFYFDLCNLDGGAEDESCFSRYPLYLVDGSRNWPLPSTEPGEYRISLKLPGSLTCNHCIFRWTYVAGNNWGYCEDGSGRLGCGPQETFKTCSDIRIAAPNNVNPSFAYCTKAV
uniref:Chitin-binding type-4 domain-containing protein n=1 Tax=Anopheles culicifacies TaxID=139723 RepID=A0A182MNE0_9DIPT